YFIYPLLLNELELPGKARGHRQGDNSARLQIDLDALGRIRSVGKAATQDSPARRHAGIARAPFSEIGAKRFHVLFEFAIDQKSAVLREHRRYGCRRRLVRLAAVTEKKFAGFNLVPAPALADLAVAGYVARLAADK